MDEKIKVLEKLYTDPDSASAFAGMELMHFIPKLKN